MSAPNFSLEGKVILITGAAQGLGAAMAQACAAQGGRIRLQDLNADGVEEVAEALRAEGYDAESSAFDLTDFAACEAWVKKTAENAGSLWGLINNAGFINHAHTTEHSVDDYKAMYDLHVFAPFVLARETARVMLRNPGPQRGRILSVSSIAATNPRPGIGNYASSKAAIAGLTRALAADFGKDGICTNAIAPGYVLTEINRKILSDESFVRRIENRTPAARWAEPEEIAGPAAFLMSEAASYINGQLLAVDGGMNAFLQANEA
ncbi:SDR family oxidoreductase [uncultured Ruegeria sp.]|uniref:SDR family NAD(P)-dependent oxidoreductase n=1 Tax=uncultured Ruegeria sp. TaxID=259304 RepID=UPI002605D860|nr:SDR family oxidoreductase [uncultured Ruegeria sp.]